MQAMTAKITKDAESLALRPIHEKHEPFQKSPLPDICSKMEEIDCDRSESFIASAKGSRLLLDRPATAPNSSNPRRNTEGELYKHLSGSIDELNDSLTASTGFNLEGSQPSPSQMRDLSFILHAMDLQGHEGKNIDELNWFDRPNLTTDAFEVPKVKSGVYPDTPLVQSESMEETIADLEPARKEKALRKEMRRVDREARHAVKDRRKAYAAAEILATRTRLRKLYRIV